MCGLTPLLLICVAYRRPQFAASILSPTAFALGLDTFAEFEDNAVGVTFATSGQMISNYRYSAGTSQPSP